MSDELLIMRWAAKRAQEKKKLDESHRKDNEMGVVEEKLNDHNSNDHEMDDMGLRNDIEGALTEHFRFMDLPAELRNYIYSFCIPTNFDIVYQDDMVGLGSGAWLTDRNDPKVKYRTGSNMMQPPTYENTDGSVTELYSTPPPLWVVDTQLFLVNKVVSAEARALLYASNTYHFAIDGDSDDKLGNRAPLACSAFGRHSNFHLLRNLRSIHIDVSISTDSYWTSRHHCGRLEYMVQVLKEHSDDENKKSMLRHLSVNLTASIFKPYLIYFHQEERRIDFEKFMFALEHLAALRGIKEVNTTGIPPWFASCLESCIKGEGGDVAEADWRLTPKKQNNRSRGLEYRKHKGKKTWVSVRKWWQPRLDWLEFAKRNGIELPEGVEKFWEERK